MTHIRRRLGEIDQQLTWIATSLDRGQGDPQWLLTERERLLAERDRLTTLLQLLLPSKTTEPIGPTTTSPSVGPQPEPTITPGMPYQDWAHRPDQHAPVSVLSVNADDKGWITLARPLGGDQPTQVVVHVPALGSRWDLILRSSPGAGTVTVPGTGPVPSDQLGHPATIALWNTKEPARMPTEVVGWYDLGSGASSPAGTVQPGMPPAERLAATVHALAADGRPVVVAAEPAMQSVVAEAVDRGAPVTAVVGTDRTPATSTAGTATGPSIAPGGTAGTDPIREFIKWITSALEAK